MFSLANKWPQTRHVGPVFASPATEAFTDLPRTGDTAYGPQKTRQLCAGQGKNQDGSPLYAKDVLMNADSYAWFANVSPLVSPTHFLLSFVA